MHSLPSSENIPCHWHTEKIPFPCSPLSGGKGRVQPAGAARGVSTLGAPNGQGLQPQSGQIRLPGANPAPMPRCIPSATRLKAAGVATLALLKAQTSEPPAPDQAEPTDTSSRLSRPDAAGAHGAYAS